MHLFGQRVLLMPQQGICSSGHQPRLDITISAGWGGQDRHASVRSTGVFKSSLVLEKKCNANLGILQQLFTGCDEHAMISVHFSQDRIKKRVERIASDPTHPRHKLFHPLPSGRHYRALHINTPNNSCELLTHEGPFTHQNRLILVVATTYLSSLSCLCENNVHLLCLNT